MKKFCIFLMKVHRFYYLLLGVLIGAIVFSQVGNVQEMIPTADMNPLIPIFIIFGICFLQVFAMAMFYTEEERINGELNGDINTFKGLVQWDNYFPVKINTALPLTKRTFGYLYVVVRGIIWISLSYTVFSIVCLFFK